ncbi:MAG TPA: sugar ABC transporter permease [Aggregatilinea sp.]|jgi:ABC-type sugar transport system permease subunit|uniref:carbohydrate ABC transporter permease n=1 Tax=Aggregatilinea sp. TaxID=2806333 RepID=UPI002C7EE7EF|nr:sugar ABC transporter permease [Aggregatilinea sp.]HML20232.1 sugar ABC transporter permease [Aggregatilinea sp.]
MQQEAAVHTGIQSTREPGALARWWKEIRHNRWAYVFISPFYILFAIFGLFPVGYSLYLSLHDWNGVRPMEYVGLENYRYVFSERGDLFWTSVQNSAIIFLLYVPLMTFLALVLAVLLNSGYIKGFRFFRTTMFMPYVTSMIAAGFVFQIMLGSHEGMVNTVLSDLGLPTVGWLDTIWGTRVSLAILVTWAWLGYNMIIMLAGLQTISQDLTEAARVDGANNVQAFFHITIPLLRPVILFSLVLSTSGTFNLFNEVVSIAAPDGFKGGTRYSILTPMILIYNTGFRHFEFGRASAEAYVYFVLIAALTFFQFRYLGNRDK